MRLWLCLLLCGAPALADMPHGYVTDWIGNTFPGLGPNGQGEWVQNMVQGFCVSPDGTAIAASEWDEAGRCTGLYRDGHANHRLLQQYNGKGGHKAWGWGTAGTAVAVLGDRIWLANTEGELLRFSWKPGDPESATYVDQATVGKAAALAARGELLVVLGVDGMVQLRRTADSVETSRFSLPGARHVAIAPDNTLWLIVGTKVVHRGLRGEVLASGVDEPQQPSHLAFCPSGRLLVCDDGPRQQLLIYYLTPKVRLVGAFGDEGGLRAGTPGRVTPTKLWGLRGAGVDAEGNVYLALCQRHQGGGTTLRSYTAAGRLRWEVQSLAFVDCFDFDPKSDGRTIYGTEEIIDYDPAAKPGAGWKLRSLTLDPSRYPDDPGVTGVRGSTGILRWVEGRRLLYVIGQMAGGVDVYAFEPPPSDVSYHVARLGPKRDGGWAWDVDARGDVWCGDAPGKSILRYRFAGWQTDGRPRFAEPESWPQPEGFDEVGRVVYVPDADTLYVAGYTPERRRKSWGLIGSVLRRYDRFTAGGRAARWTVDLPTDDEQLHPKCLDVAGDFVFTVQVKPTNGRSALVTVLRTTDGTVYGTMAPGPEVGDNSGWIDQTHGLRALRRADGSYLVLVEEDWRGKNLVYRFAP
ncbi:MAG: hypothetical protein HZB16_02915 [Armatimonadetes bacterium]|nr:hypothetical protein [Armatimonadota bacterium]